MSSITVLKSNGSREPFDPSKLTHSLLSAGASAEQATTIASKVEGELTDGISTSEIYRHAFDMLRSMPAPVEQKVVARYSMRRALAELGPTGFAFEKFVAEIFKSQGYETVTDQIVQGNCVEHEVDVVAWKGDELVMVEAKFHNELGLKSDLKVALYIKARFDDLKGRSYEYGGKKRMLTQTQLITNTKFTDHAIRYAECQGLSMIGWDYPQEGKGKSLEDLIEEAGLHPVTAIPNITEREKQLLLGQGLVLCRSVKDKEAELASYGIEKSRIPVILGDAKGICLP